MTRAAHEPHPLTPADLTDGDDWCHGCPHCHLPIQGGSAGLAAHCRTVHTRAGDPRTPDHCPALSDPGRKTPKEFHMQDWNTPDHHKGPPTMGSTVHDAAGSASEGTGLAAVLIGGAASAYLCHHLTPTAWPAGMRATAAGAAAVLGAVAAARAEVGRAPLRRLHRTHRSNPTPPAELPTTRAAGRAVIARAAAADAACQAATAVCLLLDRSDSSPLCEKDRWQGYENGQARFYLAPGMQLLADTARSWTDTTFTLVTSDSAPAAITTLADLLHHLRNGTPGPRGVPTTAGAKAAAEGDLSAR